jgi:hypothetical protein
MQARWREVQVQFERRSTKDFGRTGLRGTAKISARNALEKTHPQQSTEQRQTTAVQQERNAMYTLEKANHCTFKAMYKHRSNGSQK